MKDGFGWGGTGSGGLLRLIRSLKVCCPRLASWSTNLQRQECVMDLFVPALALNPCADKAHCAGKAGRLAKQGNAGSARIRSQPGGKPPLGAHDCVGSALKPLGFCGPAALSCTPKGGFAGTNKSMAHSRHFPTIGLRPTVRKSFTRTAKSPQEPPAPRAASQVEPLQLRREGNCSEACLNWAGSAGSFHPCMRRKEAPLGTQVYVDGAPKAQGGSEALLPCPARPKEGGWKSCTPRRCCWKE